MNNLFYDSDAFESIIIKLNREYNSMQDIHDRFLSEVVSEEKLPEPLKIRIREIRDELRRLSEKIYKLQMKAKSIKERYDDVEETNFRLAERLSRDIEFNENSTIRNRGNINIPYRIIGGGSGIGINSDYDFEDWLVEWISAN